MLVLRILVMVLTIICLMDGHAEVLSSTTGMRNGGESPAVKINKTEVKILDRKKKKPKKSKKGGKKKGKKQKPTKPKPPKPVTTTSMLKTTAISSTHNMNTTGTTIATTTKATSSTTTTTITETTLSTVSTITSATKTSTASTTISVPTTPTTTTTTTSPADPGDGGGECKATNEKPCIFPFRDGKKEYNECKNHNGKYFWCATSVYDSGTYKHWSYCPKDGSCPIEGDGECRAANNKPCIFPFKDGKKEYSECADDGGKYFWCATGTNLAGKYTSWSKCPKDGSCPLPKENTTPVMTSPATTASTIPLTTGTTAAIDEMEEKVDDTLENLVLGESRDDSLKMAHMLNEKLDTMIKDLEGEASKIEQSNSKNIQPISEKLNLTIKHGQDDYVRDGTELGEGLMFVLSTVASMKSVSKVSGDCCQDCTSKYSDTELAEYWKTLNTCYCYTKMKNFDGTDVEPKTRPSSKFTTKACEQNVCGYNSNVDTDRLLAEQNSEYLMSIMDDQKDTAVYEVLNWNNGFSNPKINHKLLAELENQNDISTGFYMLFLVPTNAACDSSVFSKRNKNLFPIHMSTFFNINTVENDLILLINNLKGKAPEWMSNMYANINPHICMAVQSTYILVAMNRVQFLTATFNFAIEAGRFFDKFYPFKECLTESSTINSMKHIVDESHEEITFEKTKTEMYEWEAILPVVVIKKYNRKASKTIAFIETKKTTADENDFINYKGPIIFDKGQNITVIFIHIKMDEKYENEESFSLTVKKMEETSKNTELQIYIKESLPMSPIGLLVRGKRENIAFEKRMKGSLFIIGTTFDGRNFDEIENLAKLSNEDKVMFELENVRVEKFHKNTKGTYNVVVFEKRLADMTFYYDLENTGQCVLAGVVELDNYKKTFSINHVFNALSSGSSEKKDIIYLPWIGDSISLIKIDDLLVPENNEEAFTAELSGCGIRLFQIKPSSYTGLKSLPTGIYMSHDNDRSQENGCPTETAYKNALFYAGYIGHMDDISFIAKVHPLVDAWQNTDSYDYITAYYNKKYPKTSTSFEKYNFLTAVVSAIRNSNNEWCLALQRNIVVYDARSLLSANDKSLYNSIYNAGYEGDFDERTQHPNYKNDQRILVMRPVVYDNKKVGLGYELICGGASPPSHPSIEQKDIEKNQLKYWDMPARLVTIWSYDRASEFAWRIYVFPNKKFTLPFSKQLTLRKIFRWPE